VGCPAHPTPDEADEQRIHDPQDSQEEKGAYQGPSRASPKDQKQQVGWKHAKAQEGSAAGTDCRELPPRREQVGWSSASRTDQDRDHDQGDTPERWARPKVLARSDQDHPRQHVDGQDAHCHDHFPWAQEALPSEGGQGQVKEENGEGDAPDCVEPIDEESPDPADPPNMPVEAIVPDHRGSVRVEHGAQGQPLLEDAVGTSQKEDGTPPLLPPHHGLACEQGSGGVQGDVQAQGDGELQGIQHEQTQGSGPREVLRDSPESRA